MEYHINASLLTSAFPVPCEVVDRHLKLAKAEHIKVLLYIMRNMSVKQTSEIALNTGVSEYDVGEALLYFADAGILVPEQPQRTAAQKPQKKTVRRAEKPNRNDIARRSEEDENIRYLMAQAQLKFGRILKDNEANTLVWLYDDIGIPVSLILYIIQYAANKEKLNIRFIEATAISWFDMGIETIEQADEQMRKEAVEEKAWSVVATAFGIEKRKPSQKEKELSVKWVDEWKLSREMLAAAYDACVNTKSKFSMPYTEKILESWHEKGYKTPEDIPQGTAKNQERDYGAYDIDLYEKMINSKD
ncbi:MAG: DnaD domain protein [Clostridia bacterium]|nr:DnaD domain protein [Clostridia bacterium]